MEDLQNKQKRQRAPKALIPIQFTDSQRRLGTFCLDARLSESSMKCIVQEIHDGLSYAAQKEV